MDKIIKKCLINAVLTDHEYTQLHIIKYHRLRACRNVLAPPEPFSSIKC